jgi:hypothetical protein
MSDLFVIGTECPEVVKEVNKYYAEERKWRTLARKIFPELKPRRLVLNQSRLEWYGFEHNNDAVPGWKVVHPIRGCSYIEPDRRTKSGKAAYQKMQDHKPPKDLRNRLPGLKNGCFFIVETEEGLRWVEAGIQIVGNLVLVRWSLDPRKDEDFSMGEQWRVVPLSEYYAIKEAAAK